MRAIQKLTVPRLLASGSAGACFAFGHAIECDEPLLGVSTAMTSFPLASSLSVFCSKRRLFGEADATSSIVLGASNFALLARVTSLAEPLCLGFLATIHNILGNTRGVCMCLCVLWLMTPMWGVTGGGLNRKIS